MIEIRNIEKIYRMGDNEIRILKGISLTIEDGDFVAIMGPSGSGKSTLMNVLGLLDVPSSGSYLLNGKEIALLSEDDLAVVRRDEIGFVFQQFNLLPRLSALENVTLPLLYTQRVVDSSIGEKLLKQVGLETRMGHRPNEMSGGQQQRVAIARALVNQPRMILADEPTGNLDSLSEKQIMAELHALNATGITIVMVTHEEEIGAQAKRLIRLRDGLVQSDVRREDFKRALPAPVKATEVQENSGVHWSEVFEHFRQGIATLASNKVRTALSILGVLIGVAAVVAMLAIGRGAQEQIEMQLASLGSNLLILRQGAVRVGAVKKDAGLVTRLTVGDAMVIKDKIPFVKAAAPSVSGHIQATYLNKNWSTTIVGVDSDYARMHSSEPDFGRFFTHEENNKRLRVAVIGMTVVRELFGERNPIGEMIKVDRVLFQVIGVMPERGASGFKDQDDQILIPLATAMHRLLGKDYVDEIEMEIDNPQHMDATQAAVLEVLFSRHRIPPAQRADAFQIRNMADLQAALSSSSRTMSLLLASIAAISLLVGGIGIMNIMLVSVSERTKEIGLRKAVGARRRDILLQFLSESVVVSAFGGISGVALGWLATVILSYFAGWATSISIASIALAFFFSALIGIVFGVYPARKASRMHPIEALRYE
jgi:macrolide transport system ATP-binding/permease protein